MTSFRAGLWQMGIGTIDSPYIGLSLSANSREEAILKSREWAALQDILPQSWLQVRCDGKTFHAEHVSVVLGEDDGTETEAVNRI